MTDVRTYRARSMQEALEVIRRELGPEAVILHSQENSSSGFWPWSRRATGVQVTAGRDLDLSSVDSSDRHLQLGNSNKRTVGLKTTKSPAVTPPQSNSLISPARENLSTSEQKINTGALANHHNRVDRAEQQSPADLASQVAALQQLLTNLTRRIDSESEVVSPELFPWYSRLINADVSEETARRLTGLLQQQFPFTNWEDAGAGQQALLSLVERELTCCGAIRPATQKRKVIAFVGPTGVGKTTTIAKLAANFKLRAGLRVGLATVDTYRVAAVDQLRTYADIINIPLRVVAGARDLKRALSEMSGLDLVLIDTAGRSPGDELQVQELRTLLAEGPVDEVHLVLSLAASAKSLMNTARKFASVSPHSVILTKLDESPSYGQILDALPQLGIPVSYLTTGQSVPDDIEPAHASRLSKLTLGIESLKQTPHAVV